MCRFPDASVSTVPRAFVFRPSKPSFNMRSGAQHIWAGSRNAFQSARVFVVKVSVRNAINGTCVGLGSPAASFARSGRPSLPKKFSQNFVSFPTSVSK